MKVNKWTLGLAAVGLVSLPAVVQAEEKLSPIQTAVASTIISGYVDTGMQWNFNTGNGSNPAYAYGGAGKADGFSLNRVKLSIEKPLDEAQWAAGYKVDLWFGPDANALMTAPANLAADDFAIKQAYVALRAPLGNGLDFKVGVFDTVIGYESHDAANNPNYTRSYGYTMEPTTHTGVLMSYRFSDLFSASVGVANTYGPIIGGTQVGGVAGFPTVALGSAFPAKAESYKTYMGSVMLTAPEDWGFLAGSTLYGGAINGLNQMSAAGGSYVQHNYYAGMTLNTPVKDLRVGASYDYVGVSEQELANGSSGGFWANAVAGYASFQATEKLSLHGRGEYVWQEYGGWGMPSKIVSATATVQYDLWRNVISRLEFRWDHSADGGEYYGAPLGAENIGGGVLVGTPSGSPDLKNAYMLALNIIYKF